ncbi:MAG: flagellar hook-length control protein FliK [Magnetospirillum gryphiswaldense]|nr:flagellar hook-length control protein FliK [Magnetospirillum gryphiswaldense]
MTTVYSINQRVFDQSSANGANNKGSSTTADQFLAALNQAGTQVAAGANAAPSAEQALKKVFDRQVDETKQAEKPAEKPKRTESKAPERKTQADDGRETEQVAEPEAKAKPKDDATASQDDGAQQDAAAPKAEKKVAKQDNETVQVVQEATAPQIEAVATVVPVEQQVAQTTVDAGEVKVAEVVAATDPENIAQGNKGQQNKGGDVQLTDAGDDAGEVMNFDPAATQQVAKAKGAQHGEHNAAAQAQADDLAANLDDTGAKLNVQVKVSEAPRPLQTAIAPEAVQAQDVDGMDMTLTTQPAATPSATPGQATATQAAQPGAAAQDPSALNKAMDVRPMVAALAAAQAEGASQPQAASSGSGNQTQAVAGLNGASGTQAASKTAQAQAAQAPRPQQMPQAKEIMDQVKVQIAKSGANGDTIKVQLKPVELGSIEVKLDVAKDGSVSGVVTADNKDTLAMLKNDSRTLEKALSDAGFKTDAGSLTFNLRGEGQSQNAQDQGTGTRRRRSVLSAANGVDATSAGMAAQAQARLGGGRAGVDIQV